MANEQTDGTRKVGGLIAGAIKKVGLEEKRRRAPYPVPGRPHEGMPPGQWRERAYFDQTGFLPENCPVRPLGYDGENFFFEDTMGQVFNSGDGSLGVERIQKLFAGHEDFLCWAWPAFDRKGGVSGFKAEHVRRDLFAACRDRGAWTMTDMVRGRGAWRDSQGKLVLHCGNHLWIDGEMEDTGERDGYFYARRPPSLAPWSEHVFDEDNPAPEIFRILRTWNFERGDLDAMIMLGWIGIAMLGGALDWRPSIFITGDAGTGKSELIGRHGLFRTILGRMMISTTNASEAGLYQLVGHDSLPIAIDEMEGDEAPEQTQKIIKMARDAASGSIRIRGGQNHKGVEFEAQSSFLFSGINPPPLPPASLTRMAIIQLRPLKVTSNKAPTLRAAETVGPRLLRVLADYWDDLEYRLEDYYNILREVGHSSRGQKTFGTFMAIADVMLGDKGLRELGLPCDERAQWGALLKPALLPELEGAEPAWKQCLDAIMTSQIEGFSGGQRRTVAQEIAKLAKDLTVEESVDAREKLAAADLAVFGKADNLVLAIPNASRTLGKALLDTAFGARNGQGPWKFALKRGPPEVILEPHQVRPEWKDNRVTVAGRQTRCIFVSINGFKNWVG